MKIRAITITPLSLPLTNPYIWSQGVENAFTVNLISIEAEDGTVGYGETTTAPDAIAQKIVLEKIAGYMRGQQVFDYANCIANAYKALFLGFGANMPRYFNQMRSGLEMAVLDLQGKLLGRPVWDLLGGALREDVGYFYFLQGNSIDDIAADAQHAVNQRHPVIYLKVGVEEKYDLEAVAAVRAAIGSTRLRLDANEAWDPATAFRMIKALEPYNIEYIEQPTNSASIDALGHVKERSAISIGADQSVFTLNDVYTACATRAADMIAVGPREIGGIRAMMQAAAIAEGAGLNICIHSSMTTGVTTCAEHHIARSISNLDDGNQIMWQLLKKDIVQSPALTPVQGRLALEGLSGFGFELDLDSVAQASERYLKLCDSALVSC